METLIIQVQVDRLLPTKKDDQNSMDWLALKVSSYWEKDTELTDFHKQAQLPWNWKSQEYANVAWDPSDPKNWTIWRKNADKYEIITGKQIDQNILDESMRSNLQMLLIDKDKGKFSDAIKDIYSINSSAHAYPDEEFPKPTVFGFLERLAVSPHPLPLVSRVHGLIAIEHPENSNFSYLAVPRIALIKDGGNVKVDINENIPIVNDEQCHQVDNTVNGINFTIKIVGSVPPSDGQPEDEALINLTKQWVKANVPTSKTLLTQDLTAKLPQQLADILDPLNRIRSVLEPLLIKQKLNAENSNKVAEPLCKALNFVAAQVLWPRLDTVGRFECPLIERLSENGNKSLKDQHLLQPSDLHKPLLDDKLDAAIRVSVDFYNKNGDQTTVLPFNSSSIESLLQQAGSAAHDQSLPSRSDEEILQTLVTKPGCLNKINANQETSIKPTKLRRFELAKTNAEDDKKTIVLKVDYITPDVDNNSQNLDDTDNSPLFDRSDCSLVYGAPFIEGLVSGRDLDGWLDPLIQNIDNNTDKSLQERIAFGMQTLLIGIHNNLDDDNIEVINQGLYGQLIKAGYEVMGQPTNGENDQAIKLFGEIMTEAAQEAIHLASTLLPDTTKPFDDYLTPIPLPLSIEVDQLRTVSRKVDPWARLSGYGLLISRASSSTGESESTAEFYSINAATLHIMRSTDSSAEANEKNAIPWRTDTDEKWKEKSIVDPVPYAPSDHVGISDAIAHYSNSWLCAPMPGDPEKTEGQDNCVRFCYGPPGSSKKLPALCFGYSYQVAAHLISQGGVLAPEIRQKDNPYELNELKLNSFNKEYIQAIKYLRTVAISAPTINVPEEADLAGQHNIPLLAEELPRRIPAILLSDKIPYRWNRDSRLGSAEVSVGDSQDDKPVGLRFEGVIKSVGLGSKLTVALWHDTAEAAIGPYIDIDTIESEPQYNNCEKWLIIDIVVRDTVQVFYALVDRAIKDFADSTWKPEAGNWIKCPNSVEWLMGKTPMLWLKANSINSILFEPVRIRRLEVPNDTPEAERKPLQSPKPQQGAIQGQTLLVNAIPQGNKHTKELQGTTIEIQWPSTDRQTWERWVNEALFTGVTNPSWLQQKVKDCLNQLQTSLEVKALPDPAVAGIWLELWEIYPAQSIVGEGLFWSVSAGNILTSISNSATKDSRLLQQIQVKINLANSSTQANPAEGLSSESQEGEQSSSYIINCNPEKIYELRAYPAINPEETTFGAIKNESRLGTAVRELFSPIPANRHDSSNDQTKKLLIGIPSVLRIEIATLPDSEISNWFNKGDDLLKIVYESQERILAQLRFPSNVVDDKIAKLRRFQSMQLAPQRWMWRGLPLGQRSWMPELMNSWLYSSTNGETERQALFGAAFSGWSDDDLGFLVNAQLKPGHFQTSMDQSQPPANPSPTMPLVLEKDLDWRHGWQLWRFRLSLKSRYAALCPDETGIVSLPGSDQWLLREIRDADNGRVPAAPPLALVLPLTEPLQHEGTVPPLLALFHTTMHEEQHFGDGIAVLVDAVHVPFNDDIGLLAQFGPDPIRTGTGHDRSAVALRLDGPIGYSFDNDDTSAAFGYSGYLVTPVSSAIQPWSFIRLSFLRFENPRGLVSARFSEFMKSGELQDYHINNRRILEIPSWKCAANQPLTTDPDKRKLRYEGLVLQFQLEKENAKYPSSLEINIGDSKTKIHFSPTTDSNSSLFIECKLITDNKNKTAGKHNLILNKKYTLRLVVSGLPGSSFLLLQLWQESDSSPPFSEGTEPLDQNTWLTLFHVPMDPTVTLNNLQIIEDWSNSAQNDPTLISTENIYPIRLSRATEPVWCQFTAACSVFNVSKTSANDEAPNSWSVDKLQAALNSFTPLDNTLLENQEQNLATWKSLRIYEREDKPTDENTLYIHPSLHNIDANSDLEETILAVFTEWAFTQDLRRNKALIERPVLADFLIKFNSNNSNKQSCLQAANKINTQTNEQNGEQNLPPPLWSSAFDGTKFLWPITDTPARVRLLRVLLRKNNGSQSNQSSDISSLLELFSQTRTAEPPFSNNPPDAKGMILGISKPFPWHFIEEN
jgi:hypothetical protein